MEGGGGGESLMISSLALLFIVFTSDSAAGMAVKGLSRERDIKEKDMCKKKWKKKEMF